MAEKVSRDRGYRSDTIALSRATKVEFQDFRSDLPLGSCQACMEWKIAKSLAIPPAIYRSAFLGQFHNLVVLCWVGTASRPVFRKQFSPPFKLG